MIGERGTLWWNAKKHYFFCAMRKVFVPFVSFTYFCWRIRVKIIRSVLRKAGDIHNTTLYRIITKWPGFWYAYCSSWRWCFASLALKLKPKSSTVVTRVDWSMRNWQSGRMDGKNKWLTIRSPLWEPYQSPSPCHNAYLPHVHIVCCRHMAADRQTRWEDGRKASHLTHRNTISCCCADTTYRIWQRLRLHSSVMW